MVILSILRTFCTKINLNKNSQFKIFLIDSIFYKNIGRMFKKCMHLYEEA